MAVKGKNQHVVKRDKGWPARGEGNTKDTSHHLTQQEAADAARAIVQNQKSEVLIHGRDKKSAKGTRTVTTRIHPKGRPLPPG